MSNQCVLCTADISIDGATFAVFCAEHGEGGAIYRNVSGTQYKLIRHTPLDRESLPLQNYICPVLGSKTTVKLAVAFECIKTDTIILYSRFSKRNSKVMAENAEGKRKRTSKSSGTLFIKRKRHSPESFRIHRRGTKHCRFNAMSGKARKFMRIAYTSFGHG
jgi:hypothetical protein